MEDRSAEVPEARNNAEILGARNPRAWEPPDVRSLDTPEVAGGNYSGPETLHIPTSDPYGMTS
jgi:hypothetical protein